MRRDQRPSPESSTPASTSATCRPSCFSVAEATQAAFDVEHAAEVAEDDGVGAGGEAMSSHLRSAMREEISPYLMANVPPKPQQSRASPFP
jgi:hypothetical protein